jgi:hypothetical protein
MREDGAVDAPSFFVQLFFTQPEMCPDAALAILSNLNLVSLASASLDLLCILACRRTDPFRP